MVDQPKAAQPDLDDDDDDDEEDQSAPRKSTGKKPHFVYVIVGLAVIGIIGVVYFLRGKTILPPELVPIKVLFVGNDTLPLHDLPKVVREVARMSKSKCRLEVSCIAREDYRSGEHVKETAAHKLIDENKWDYVVLQDRWLQPLQDPAGMLESTRTIAKSVRKKGSHVILFVPWADAGDDKSQEVLSSVSRRLAERLSIDVAPAGDVFFAVLKKHKEINPYVADKHHVSSIGAWLAAATLYVSVTGEKPKLIADQFTYQSGEGEEPQVPIVGDAAGDIETIVWQTVTEQNRGRQLGPRRTPAKGLDFKRSR